VSDLPPITWTIGIPSSRDATQMINISRQISRNIRCISHGIGQLNALAIQATIAPRRTRIATTSRQFKSPISTPAIDMVASY
jgi:hypothetical protein